MMAGYTRHQLDNVRIARRAAKAAGINPDIFERQMRQEANFSDATSPKGAGGPAQIMPATAAGWGVHNVHDPHEAYTAAAQHMASYLRSYGGDWSKALTAYNAGPGKVGGALPAETRAYIHTILGGSSPITHKQAVSAGSGKQPITGTPPTLNRGGTTTDTQGAVVAALLDPRKKMSLASRVLENVQSGKYTTTTKPTVAPGKAPKGYGVSPTKATASQPPHAKPGSPTAGGTSEGGLHETMGLAGYPAHDYFAPAGSRAVAPVSGTVVRLSGHDPAGGPTQGPHGPLGWSVYIRGDDGRTYYLTHMGSRTVKAGQRLKQGQAIGTVANYDKYGTPSHIHMGVSG